MSDQEQLHPEKQRDFLAMEQIVLVPGRQEVISRKRDEYIARLGGHLPQVDTGSMKPFLADDLQNDVAYKLAIAEALLAAYEAGSSSITNTEVIAEIKKEYEGFDPSAFKEAWAVMKVYVEGGRLGKRPYVLAEPKVERGPSESGEPEAEDPAPPNLRNLEEAAEEAREGEGLEITKLPPDTLVVVSTSDFETYELLFTDPAKGEALMRYNDGQGKKAVRTVTFVGSTYGGSILVADWLGQGMYLEIAREGHKGLTTHKVVDFYTEGNAEVAKEIRGSEQKDSPETEPDYRGFKEGQSVKVLRSPASGGHIEDGWEIARLYSNFFGEPSADVSNAKEDIKKEVTITDLELWNK